MSNKPLPAQGPVDVNVRPRTKSAYRRFDGMCWAVPGERMDELEHLLRYAPKDTAFTMQARLTIASFLSAYRQLVVISHKRRNARVMEIRKGPNIAAEEAPPTVELRKEWWVQSDTNNKGWGPFDSEADAWDFIFPYGSSEKDRQESVESGLYVGSINKWPNVEFRGAAKRSFDGSPGTQGSASPSRED